MSEYKITSRAYTKMMFHAAKYPHCAVNGLLLSEKDSSENKKFKIVDAVPLFHQCLFVSPMAEIALLQVEAYANEEGLQIAGYYCAPENFNEFSVERCPGLKIADKINENYPNSCLIMIDNKLVTLACEREAIKVFQNIDNRWIKTAFLLDQSEATLDAVSSLLKRGAMKDIIDFDNHLDNPEMTWDNEHLNKDLKQIMAMY
ncbi:ER membrane protein complex subunit 8/9 homolog [Condylostylus longicornis]|uniref:ER membrane protein complex subunit 8/9 homolog n=1 Tax=Condylostylus longicornis TaxID=2530218 RepID=UPI00244E11E5|nr:ER membrane protein complex subunit 8/9 homolog [Condylostylus longicornis]